MRIVLGPVDAKSNQCFQEEAERIEKAIDARLLSQSKIVKNSPSRPKPPFQVKNAIPESIREYPALPFDPCGKEVVEHQRSVEDFFALNAVETGNQNFVRFCQQMAEHATESLNAISTHAIAVGNVLSHVDSIVHELPRALEQQIKEITDFKRNLTDAYRLPFISHPTPPHATKFDQSNSLRPTSLADSHGPAVTWRDDRIVVFPLNRPNTLRQENIKVGSLIRLMIQRRPHLKEILLGIRERLAEEAIDYKRCVLTEIRTVVELVIKENLPPEMHRRKYHQYNFIKRNIPGTVGKKVIESFKKCNEIHAAEPAQTHSELLDISRTLLEFVSTITS